MIGDVRIPQGRPIREFSDLSEPYPNKVDYDFRYYREVFFHVHRRGRGHPLNYLGDCPDCTR